MRFTITKQFHFSASHQLDHLAATDPNHPCARLHGHNYVVELELESTCLDGNGFVLDYNALRPFQRYLDQKFDHRHLNDVVGQSVMTTAENLAWHFYDIASQMLKALPGMGHHVTAARVKETPKTMAEYRPGE